MKREITFVNLTSHELNETTTGIRLKPSGVVVRVHQTTEKVAEYSGMPIYKAKFGEVLGLPEPKEGIIYVVSAMALSAISESRKDVVAPGFLKRDANGVVVGSVGFRTR